MKKNIYDALTTFYGVKKKDTKSKKLPCTHRMMFLPKGLLGADGMIASMYVTRALKFADINSTFEYRLVDNDSETERSEILQMISEQFETLAHTTLGNDGFMSIAFLGIRNAPTEDEIKRATEANPYPFNTIDVYKYGKVRDISSTFEVKKDQSGNTVTPSIIAQVSYGDIPALILGKFMKEYEHNTHDDVSWYRAEILALAYSTKTTTDGHLYVPLKEKGKAIIELYRWCDTSIDDEYLYTSDAKRPNHSLRSFLGKKLCHYMAYMHCHREDPTDEKYINFIAKYMEKNSPFNMITDLDDMIFEEMKLIRSTLLTIQKNAKIVSQKAAIFEIDGKPVKFNLPVIVEYTGSMENPLPYEGIVCDYLKRIAWIGRNLDEHCIDNSAHDKSKNTAGWNVFLETADISQSPMVNAQKINTLIKRDPDIGVMIIRGRNDVINRAIWETITDKGANKECIVHPANTEDFMLTGADFVYDPRLAKPAEEKTE